MSIANSRFLPLLDKEKEVFAKVDLSNTLIICVQHLCSTTYSLFEALFDLGLKQSNLYALGKCYSTNPEIYYQLQHDGVNVSPASMFFNSHLSYDFEFDANVSKLIQNVICARDLTTFDQVIILDDGGHLIDKARQLLPKTLKCVGVEQTSSGFNRLKNTKLHFPIINSARSWVKLEYESPIIANLVKRKLLSFLDEYVLSQQEILLLGCGSLGSIIYNEISNNFNVTRFDIRSNRSDFSKHQLRDCISRFDVIIGCTGDTSLSLCDYSYLKKGVVLASVSSSDREFDAVNLRKKNTKYHECHKNLFVEGIHLLNSGFPITFGTDYESIDTNDFQLTRSILFSSICQAVTNNYATNEFVDIDEDIQFRIMDEFRRIYDDASEESYFDYRGLSRVG